MLLIQRSSVVLRKSVSCRLLGVGRTHWGALSILPCALHEPPGSTDWARGPFGVAWCSHHSWGVWCHSGWEVSVGIKGGKWIACKEGNLSASDHSSWSKSFGWANDPCLSLCNPIVFGSIFPEIWMHSRVVIQSWKGWKKPRGHLIHSFALIQD